LLSVRYHVYRALEQYRDLVVEGCPLLSLFSSGRGLERSLWVVCPALSECVVGDGPIIGAITLYMRGRWVGVGWWRGSSWWRGHTR